MGKVRKYIFEILMVIVFIAIGVMLIACNSETDKTDEVSPIPSATVTPEATPTPVVLAPSATPEPTEKPLEFETGGKEYFDDALFIGDSRTVGLDEYADMGNATFFSSVGMNSFKVFDEVVDVDGVGSVRLRQLLESKKFGKIYILLGINELGSDIDIIAEKIIAIEECIKETQPDALIFMQANMHVTANRNNSDKTFNNERINALNEKLAARADQKKVFYIDVNEYFDDENGCLKSDISGDGIHVTAKGYTEWGEWLCTKQIYTPEMYKPVSGDIKPVVTPTVTPTPAPTATATPKPTPEPTPSPSPEATAEPTPETDTDEKEKEEAEPTKEASEEKTETEDAPSGGKSYLDDALFIGDSRTVGLRDYANMGDASFFCSVGMNSFKVFNETVSVKGVGNVTLKQLLDKKQFGKVYILFGINEIGSDLDTVAAKITAIADYVRSVQPGAKVIIQANLHVTAKKDASSDVFTNKRINALNKRLKAYGGAYYLDANKYFDDENGCLPANISGDGVHITANAYKQWGNWIASNKF